MAYTRLTTRPYNKKRFSCKRCGERFSKLWELGAHANKEHGEFRKKRGAPVKTLAEAREVVATQATALEAPTQGCPYCPECGTRLAAYHQVRGMVGGVA